MAISIIKTRGTFKTINSAQGNDGGSAKLSHVGHTVNIQGIFKKNYESWTLYNNLPAMATADDIIVNGRSGNNDIALVITNSNSNDTVAYLQYRTNNTGAEGSFNISYVSALNGGE